MPVRLSSLEVTKPLRKTQWGSCSVSDANGGGGGFGRGSQVGVGGAMRGK